MAHVYLPDIAGRATREQIDAVHPDLVRGLASHPQVGLVLVRSGGVGGVGGPAAGRPVAVGADGWRCLDGDDPVGEGVDPTAVYGRRAAAALAQLDARAHVGDLVVLGAYDPHLGEVTAFEELVGSHGGLGGGQTGAVLLAPAHWSVPGEHLVAMSGIDVHRLLIEHLELMGLRADAPVPADRAERATPVPSAVERTSA